MISILSRLIPGKLVLPLALALMFIAAGAFIWYSGGKSERQNTQIENLQNEKATNDAITEGEARAAACGGDWYSRILCFRDE